MFNFLRQLELPAETLCLVGEAQKIMAIVKVIVSGAVLEGKGLRLSDGGSGTKRNPLYERLAI